jgi:hypothetical protein
MPPINDQEPLETFLAPCGCRYTAAGIKTLWARYTQSLGGGRPRLKNRCPCGKFTRERARIRAHHCTREG